MQFFTDPQLDVIFAPHIVDGNAQRNSLLSAFGRKSLT
jgi:hypothetical protein